MNTLTIQSYRSIQNLPRAARDLLDTQESISFDAGCSWYALLQNTASSNPQNIVFATVWDNREPIAILPLSWPERPEAWSRKRSCRAEALSGFYTSLFVPALLREHPAIALGVESVIRRLVQDRAHVHQLRLYPMDTSDSAYELLQQGIRHAGWVVFTFFSFGNWYLPCAGLSFSEYFASRPSRLCHTVERKERKFLAKSRGKLVLVTGGEDLDAGIAAYENIYRASWKRREPYPNFMPSLIRVCAKRGWLRLGLAYYDDEPVAAQVWIVNAGKASIYKLAYDERYAKLSAGTLLSKFLMRHVLDEDKVCEVDYLVGDDAYKQDWMSHRRERWGIVAYNPHTFKGLLGAAREVAGRLAKRVMTGVSSPKSIQGKA